MTPGNPQLSALFVSNPSEAVVRVRRALSTAKGDVGQAAKALRVSVPTVYRWIKTHPEIRNGNPAKRVRT